MFIRRREEREPIRWYRLADSHELVGALYETPNDRPLLPAPGHMGSPGVRRYVAMQPSMVPAAWLMQGSGAWRGPYPESRMHWTSSSLEDIMHPLILPYSYGADHARQHNDVFSQWVQQPQQQLVSEHPFAFQNYMRLQSSQRPQPPSQQQQPLPEARRPLGAPQLRPQPPLRGKLPFRNREGHVGTIGGSQHPLAAVALSPIEVVSPPVHLPWPPTAPPAASLPLAAAPQDEDGMNRYFGSTSLPRSGPTAAAGYPPPAMYEPLPPAVATAAVAAIEHGVGDRYFVQGLQTVMPSGPAASSRLQSFPRAFVLSSLPTVEPCVLDPKQQHWQEQVPGSQWKAEWVPSKDFRQGAWARPAGPTRVMNPAKLSRLAPDAARIAAIQQWLLQDPDQSKMALEKTWSISMQRAASTGMGPVEPWDKGRGSTTVWEPFPPLWPAAQGGSQSLHRKPPVKTELVVKAPVYHLAAGASLTPEKVLQYTNILYGEDWDSKQPGQRLMSPQWPAIIPAALNHNGSQIAHSYVGSFPALTADEGNGAQDSAGRGMSGTKRLYSMYNQLLNRLGNSRKPTATTTPPAPGSNGPAEGEKKQDAQPLASLPYMPDLMEHISKSGRGGNAPPSPQAVKHIPKAAVWQAAWAAQRASALGDPTAENAAVSGTSPADGYSFQSYTVYGFGSKPAVGTAETPGNGSALSKIDSVPAAQQQEVGQPETPRWRDRKRMESVLAPVFVVDLDSCQVTITYIHGRTDVETQTDRRSARDAVSASDAADRASHSSQSSSIGSGTGMSSHSSSSALTSDNMDAESISSSVDDRAHHPAVRSATKGRLRRLLKRINIFTRWRQRGEGAQGGRGGDDATTKQRQQHSAATDKAAEAGGDDGAMRGGDGDHTNNVNKDNDSPIDAAGDAAAARIDGQEITLGATAGSGEDGESSSLVRRIKPQSSRRAADEGGNLGAAKGTLTDPDLDQSQQQSQQSQHTGSRKQKKRRTKSTEGVGDGVRQKDEDGTANEGLSSSAATPPLPAHHGDARWSARLMKKLKRKKSSKAPAGPIADNSADARGAPTGNGNAKKSKSRAPNKEAASSDEAQSAESREVEGQVSTGGAADQRAGTTQSRAAANNDSEQKGVRFLKFRLWKQQRTPGSHSEVVADSGSSPDGHQSSVTAVEGGKQTSKQKSSGFNANSTAVNGVRARKWFKFMRPRKAKGASSGPERTRTSDKADNITDDVVDEVTDNNTAVSDDGNNNAGAIIVDGESASQPPSNGKTAVQTASDSTGLKGKRWHWWPRNSTTSSAFKWFPRAKLPKPGLPSTNADQLDGKKNNQVTSAHQTPQPSAQSKTARDAIDVASTNVQPTAAAAAADQGKENMGSFDQEEPDDPGFTQTPQASGQSIDAASAGGVLRNGKKGSRAKSSEIEGQQMKSSNVEKKVKEKVTGGLFARFFGRRHRGAASNPQEVETNPQAVTTATKLAGSNAAMDTDDAPPAQGTSSSAKHMSSARVGGGDEGATASKKKGPLPEIHRQLLGASGATTGVPVDTVRPVTAANGRSAVANSDPAAGAGPDGQKVDAGNSDEIQAVASADKQEEAASTTESPRASTTQTSSKLGKGKGKVGKAAAGKKSSATPSDLPPPQGPKAKLMQKLLRLSDAVNAQRAAAATASILDDGVSRIPTTNKEEASDTATITEEPLEETASDDLSQPRATAAEDTVLHQQAAEGGEPSSGLQKQEQLGTSDETTETTTNRNKSGALERLKQTLARHRTRQPTAAAAPVQKITKASSPATASTTADEHAGDEDEQDEALWGTRGRQAQQDNIQSTAGSEADLSETKPVRTRATMMERMMASLRRPKQQQTAVQEMVTFKEVHEARGFGADNTTAATAAGVAQDAVELFGPGVSTSMAFAVSSLTATAAASQSQPTLPAADSARGASPSGSGVGSLNTTSRLNSTTRSNLGASSPYGRQIHQGENLMASIRSQHHQMNTGGQQQENPNNSSGHLSAGARASPGAASGSWAVQSGTRPGGAGGPGSAPGSPSLQSVQSLLKSTLNKTATIISGQGVATASAAGSPLESLKETIREEHNDGERGGGGGHDRKGVSLSATGMAKQLLDLGLPPSKW